MTGQMILWFFLSCKRVMKRPLFLLLFLLLPLGAWMFRQAEEEDSGKIPIALFMDGDEWNRRTTDVLMAGDGAFGFYLCESKEELKDDVAAGRAECGYSFPADLRERMETGDYRRAIRVTVSPATVAAELASETVFAGLFEVYGRELLEHYVKNGEAFSEARETQAQEALWAEVEQLYEEALKDGSTFAFSYETVGGGGIRENSVKAVFPVRGIGAVFLFVMGLAAAVTAAEDENRGFYRAVTADRKRILQMISIAAMVFLSGMAVFAALVVSGEIHVGDGTVQAVSAGISAEAVSLALYGMLTVFFSAALLLLVRNPFMLSGMIPLFILGSLISCPVFVDLSAFLPVLAMVRRFFLPWYYLMM